MDDPLVCLGCGGVVVEGAEPALPPGSEACTCQVGAPEAAVLRCGKCGGALRAGARACPWCRATVATRRCEHCLAWNLAEAAHCHACGRAQGEAAAAGVQSALACPRCSGRLMARSYAQLEVSECDACGGLHLSPPMMDRLVAARDASTNLHLALPRHEYAPETEVRYLKCPVCVTLMNRKMFGRISGVVVDTCRVHGVWFDAGELSRILAFIERGGLSTARQREIEELRQAERSSKAEVLRVASAQAQVSVSSFEMHRQTHGLTLAADLVAALADLWR